MPGQPDADRDDRPGIEPADAPTDPGSSPPTPDGEPVDEAPFGDPPPPEAVVEQVEVPGVDRTSDRRLARLHLRTGARGLARAELESLAGAGGLDGDALLDLAEVRWRTDDLTGAGEAAAAYLASGREAPLALIIVAEAIAALGRPTEARRLANRAAELSGGSLDPLFAGMPHSEVWPAQPAERGPEPATGSVVAVAAAPAIALAPDPPPGAVGARSTSADQALLGSVGGGTPSDPGAELASARAAIAAGDRDGAAIRLAVVLRLTPALAPAVLDVVAAESGPGFDLIRGDALRLVGRESQARRSYAAARASVPTPHAAAQPVAAGSDLDGEPDPGPDRDDEPDGDPDRER